MFFWVMMLPVSFNWMSPVLIIMGGFEGYITMSFIVFSVWFISSLFIGRAYCAYGCQWGAGQEILGEIIPKQLDKKKKARNRKIKYVIFVIWIIPLIIGPVLLNGYINGVNLFYPNEPTELNTLISFSNEAVGQLIFYFGILGGVVILFTLIGGKRAFCNYACPMAILGIIGTKVKNLLKYPSLHLESEADKCTNCKICSKSCVMDLDVNEMVQSNNMYNRDCILCGSCVSSCKNDVIHYAWKWKK
jgi:polyferredoxin